MSERILLTIALIIFALPVGFSAQVGFNRAAKIGIVLVIVGIACILFSQYILHENATYELFTKEYGSKTESNRIFLNIWSAGIWTAVLGGCTLFIGSAARAWKKRSVILPFLFK